VFIDYLPSLIRRPFEFFSCFISYSSVDQRFAEKLHTDLQDTGVRCWFAPSDMKIGDRIRDRIDESIRFHDKLLLVLSADSISSRWVETEVEAAMEHERRGRGTLLFPIRVDDAILETDKPWASEIRRTRHIGDFRGWLDAGFYQTAFTRLLRDLKPPIDANLIDPGNFDDDIPF